MNREEGDEELALYVISVAAELSGLHPQTLRQYDRIGLVSPSRAQGEVVATHCEILHFCEMSQGWLVKALI